MSAFIPKEDKNDEKKKKLNHCVLYIKSTSFISSTKKAFSPEEILNGPNSS